MLIGKSYIGATEANRVYLGSTLVYQKAATSSPKHRVYSDASVPAVTAYSDGTPYIRLGSAFYRFGGSSAPWRCVGGRIRIPNVPALSGALVKLWAFRRNDLPSTQNLNPSSGNTDWNAFQEKTITLPSISGPTWAEAFWDTPFTLENASSSSSNQIAFIGYEFLGAHAGYYLFTSGNTVGSGPVQADDGSTVYLAEAGSRSLFAIGAQSGSAQSTAWYGSDIIVDEG